MALNFRTRWEKFPGSDLGHYIPEKNSPVFNVQAVGGPLSRSERGDIIIITIINFENFNLLKYILVLFIRYTLNTRMMKALYGTTDAEFQMTGVTQNIPSQLNASG
jgi:hypothetical protein